MLFGLITAVAATRGLLRRRSEETDGRVSLIELTPTGDQLAKRFIRQLASLTDPLRATWPEQQQRLAVEVLNALARTLETQSAAEEHRGLRPAHEPEDELWIVGRHK